MELYLTELITADLRLFWWFYFFQTDLGKLYNNFTIKVMIFILFRFDNSLLSVDNQIKDMGKNEKNRNQVPYILSHFRPNVSSGWLHSKAFLSESCNKPVSRTFYIANIVLYLIIITISLLDCRFFAVTSVALYQMSNAYNDLSNVSSNVNIRWKY